MIETNARTGARSEAQADLRADSFRLAGREYRSRLIAGTGKYATMELMAEALEACGTEIVTVAIRRVNLADRSQKSILDYLDPGRYTLLPNTAGCYTVEEALRTARLAREATGSTLIKLEVIGDPRTLFPDNEQTVAAAAALVREGFTVLPYCLDDPIVCRKLEEVGCAAVMPLAAPIGSGLGIRNPYNIRIILEAAKVPVIVDAGVGQASDVAVAMELGIDAVLLNTAIAGAKEPVLMAEAMKAAVEAGRKSFLAGRIPKRLYAQASSPLEGMIE
jgi:thiazole synthase